MSLQEALLSGSAGVPVPVGDFTEMRDHDAEGVQRYAVDIATDTNGTLVLDRTGERLVVTWNGSVLDARPVAPTPRPHDGLWHVWAGHVTTANASRALVVPEGVDPVLFAEVTLGKRDTAAEGASDARLIVRLVDPQGRVAWSGTTWGPGGTASLTRGGTTPGEWTLHVEGHAPRGNTTVPWTIRYALVP